MVEGGRKNPNL